MIILAHKYVCARAFVCSSRAGKRAVYVVCKAHSAYRPTCLLQRQGSKRMSIPSLCADGVFLSMPIFYLSPSWLAADCYPVHRIKDDQEPQTPSLSSPCDLVPRQVTVSACCRFGWSSLPS
jgi:hypothetical protein